MHTDSHTSYKFVSNSCDDNFRNNNFRNNNNAAVSVNENPTVAIGISSIAASLGVGELECGEIVRYVDGSRATFEEATIRRHDEMLALLPKLAIEASAQGEISVVIDSRAYYRNFAYPQLNYPSPYEILRVVKEIEAQGFVAILQAASDGRCREEDSSHSALYELRAGLHSSAQG